MRYLLDTHIVITMSIASADLSPALRNLLTDPENEIFFSVVSLWEIAVKSEMKRSALRLDAGLLRANLLRERFQELELKATHVLELPQLPLLHHDPFDRMLLSQAIAERLPLLTKDRLLLQYPVGTRRA